MSAPFDTVLTAALALSPENRWALISCIAETLPSPPLHPAWEIEIARRCEELDSGQVQGIPFDEVMASLKAKYETDLPGS